jgi:thioredoxin-dependent peroxiredoxin
MNGLRLASQSWQALCLQQHTAKRVLFVLSLSTIMNCGISPVLAEEKESTPECCAHPAKALSILKVNDKAPDFTLPSQLDKPVKLSSFQGKSIVVVYFYPKDFTPICTKESKAFRDNYEAFKQAGAEVIGISGDSVESHKSFADEQKLPFLLLSDADDRVRKAWRIPNSLGALPGRVTFVIDKKGVIRSVFNAPMEDKKHVSGALEVIENLKKQIADKS